MLIKFSPTTNLILLIPAPLLAYDFIENWYLLYTFLYLLILSLFRFHKNLFVVNLVAIYYHMTNNPVQSGPEYTVPILGLCLISFFHQNRSKNTFEAYSFFLWLGTFALFSASFYYLIYITAVLIIIFFHLNTDGKLSIRNLVSNLLKNRNQILITLFVTGILFLIFPRIHNFLPSVQQIPKGKIGYSKEISNSTTAQLNLSSQPALYAELDRRIPQQDLYWRGRVHTITDGYNWRHRESIIGKSKKSFSKNQVKQKIQYLQNFEGDIILLDRATKITETNIYVYRLNETGEFRSSIHKKKITVEAISTIDAPKLELHQKIRPVYLQLPKNLSKKLIEFSNSIKTKKANEIIREFEQKILNDRFTYSLKPGALPTIDSFIERKIGYCTHFSSLLGLTLRHKGIPARLISGFQGGRLNPVSGHYEVKSNDAHAWVEFYDGISWKRVDPTGFVSPDRIQLGGEQFFNPSAVTSSNLNKAGFFERNYYQAKQYLLAFNYKISSFIDNYDRTKQKELAKVFKLSLKSFIYFGLFIVVLVFMIYYFSFRINRQKVSLHPADELLLKLNKKLKKEDIYFPLNSPINELKDLVKDGHHKDLILNFLNFYQEYRYGKVNHHEVLSKIIAQL